MCTQKYTHAHTHTLEILLKSVQAFAFIYVKSYPSFWKGQLDRVLPVWLAFSSTSDSCPDLPSISSAVYLLLLIKGRLFFFPLLPFFSLSI